MPFNITDKIRSKRVSCGLYKSKRKWWRHATMMMSSNGNISHVCAGNSPVTGQFPTQRSVTRSFDVFFDLRMNKQLSKQSWGWWFETSSCSLWRHRNDASAFRIIDTHHYGPAMWSISSLLTSCSTKSWVVHDAQGDERCLWGLEGMGPKPRLLDNPTLS